MPTNAGRAWAIFAVCAVGFMFSMFYRIALSVIVPQLTRDLNLNTAQLGALSAAFFYGFAACQIPLGLWLDRRGVRLPMILLGLLAAVAAAAFALAHNYTLALAARLALGVGMSCNLMGALVLVGAWFPPQQFATLSGLMIACGALGQMLAATPLALMAQGLGWRGSFLIVAGLNALQIAVFWALVRDRRPGAEPPPEPESHPLAGLGRLLSSPAYWGISFGSFIRHGCMVALQALWAGLALIYGLGFTPVETGNALFALSLGYMVSLPMSGRLSDRLLATRKWVVLPGFVLGALVLGVMDSLPRGTWVWLIYGLFFVFGLAMGPGQIMYAHISELMPARLKATALTGVNLFTMLGPAGLIQITCLLGPGEAARISGPESFSTVWWFMITSLLVSALVYLAIPDSSALRQKKKPAAALDQ